MSTPHINAKKGDFATTVLLAGDPLRAKFIANRFLTKATEITNVRNMLGFTGEYQGKLVSVMGGGMGIPSCSIYAKELITEYQVKNIIRIGSAGGLKNTKLQDIIIALGASTDSKVNRMRLAGYDFSATANFALLQQAYNIALKKKITVKIGNCFSTDLFYHPDTSRIAIFEKMQILCLEMETAGLYGVATEYHANALALLTISDLISTGESLSAQARETTFTQMITIALNLA